VWSNPGTGDGILAFGPREPVTEVEYEAQQGVSGPGPTYFFPGDEYLALHSAETCVWECWNREMLGYPGYGLMVVVKNTFEGERWWYVSAKHMSVDTLAFFDYGYSFPEIYGVPDGRIPIDPPFEAYRPDTPVGFRWRDVMKEAECRFLPAMRARSDVISIHPQNMSPGGSLLGHLENARALFASQDYLNNVNAKYLYKPSKMDIAASFAMSAGMTFGIVKDSGSPLYRQFTIFDGGVYEDFYVPPDPIPKSRLIESAWRLTTGEFRAEFGHVNRFERVLPLYYLPDWVELTLHRR
jgi:hypothetical protein